MRSIVEWLDFGLPWWLWLGPAGVGVAAAFIAVSRVFGVRNALAAAGALAAFALLAVTRQRGRQEGWNKRIEKEERDAANTIRRAEEARRRAQSVPDERLRDDDGFRRD